MIYENSLYFKVFQLGMIETNCYVVWDNQTHHGFILDPGDSSQDVIYFIEKERIKIQYIINTHGHADHIFGNSFYKKHFNVPLLIHQDDVTMLANNQKNLAYLLDMNYISPSADILLYDNMELLLGKKQLRVISTPGHTPGSICLFHYPLLFSGDTLFKESIGRTDLPGGDFNKINISIMKKIIILPLELNVFPGHGENTTLKHEIKSNPFIKAMKENYE